MDDIYLCHECGKVFYKLSTLESHTRWKHSNKSVEYMCDQCGRTFQKKYNLQKHIEVGVHHVAETVRCAAEECGFRSQNRRGMCSHYENYHGISLSETTVHFNSTEEFFDWKTDYENKTRARFVKMSSSRKRKNGVIKCTYLCHRDGNFIPKGKNIRHIKGKGSNKINAHCPAKLEVDIGEKIVTVSYIDTHVGHDLDVSRLSLNPSDRAEIAKLLAMQVPFEDILRDVNSSPKSFTDSNGVKRLDLLTRKDLWNIVETFKINPKTVKYSKSRSKRKKREANDKTCWLKVVKQEENSIDENHEIVCDAAEGDDEAGEGENVIVYPVLVKGENEYYDEYTVVPNDDVDDDDENNCLIINSQGELQSINGHHIIYTENGDIQIYQPGMDYEDVELVSNDENVVLVSETVDDGGELSIAEDEENGNVCEMTETGEIIFIDNQRYQIEKPSDCEEGVVESIVGFEEETITESINSDLEVKQEIYDAEYTESNGENDTVQRVANSPVDGILKYEVAEQDFDADQVNEYVIISTEDDESNVILTEESDVMDESCLMSTGSSDISILDNVPDIFTVKKTNVIKPKWDEKRKEVLNKLLNVHSMINNEKQLTVLTKNISSLENVIKSLSENDKQVPHTDLES